MGSRGLVALIKATPDYMVSPDCKMGSRGTYVCPTLYKMLNEESEELAKFIAKGRRKREREPEK